ncbi:putative flippase GtrA [Arthrobacter sp. B2I5]|uniref:GtrA family protein n=1 Tax=Arthrobacter sp. B2I5 TaxID=3042266 RepID=UPI002789EF67|nr:GtrA family protein [Arthrobacter sp. B2I5]MDQ0827258.1 putative flippase GtrA [Arthrobacter sp. B2I5]
MSSDRQQKVSLAATTARLPEALKTDRYRLARPVMKFAIVGVINNLIGYGTFVMLSLAGVPALGAMTISYALGMAISFSGNRKWTFGHRGKLSHALARFLAVNAVGYGLNFLILTLFVVTWHLPQIPVQLAAVGLVAVVTFLLMRFWAFRDKTPSLEDTVAR